MNPKSFRLMLSSSIAAAALLSGCATRPNSGEPAPGEVTGVKTETVQFQSLPEEYEAVGTVRSATTSILGPQISGTILAVKAKPGDRVRRGQVLALLDNRSPKAGLEAAQAGVQEIKYGVTATEDQLEAAVAEQKLAEATFSRYQKLLARNSVTRQEFDGAEARYKSATANVAGLKAKLGQMEAQSRQTQAQLASAQTVFSYSSVVSPIDGVLTEKLIDAGTLVMPGTPLLTVEDPVHFRLEASVPQALNSKIHLGQQATVSIDEGQWPGRVSEIVPAADPSTRTFIVKVALPATCRCQSGEYGKADFVVGEKTGLAVPRSAVIERGELKGVYVLNLRGIAEYRLVTTGREFGDRVEILSGLSGGERVAVSGLEQLRDGAQVAPE